MDLPGIDPSAQLPASAAGGDPPPLREHEASGPAQVPLLWTVFDFWGPLLPAAGLVTVLAGALAARDRQREHELAEARQRAADHELLARIGSVAAGAVHALGSPLNTIALVVEDLAEELAAQRRSDPGELARGLDTIAAQLEACRGVLAGLAQDPGGAEDVDSRVFLDRLLAHWRRTRPDVALVRRDAGTALPPIAADVCLARGLENLLNNAADAGDGEVELECAASADALTLHIRDRGPGIAPEFAGAAARPFVTTKGRRGLGLGLLLARTAIRHAGGSLRLSRREGGGTCATVCLPAAPQRAGLMKAGVPRRDLGTESDGKGERT